VLTSLWDLFFFFCFLFQFDVIFGYNWRSQKRKQQARDFILFVFFNVIGIREVASSDTKFFFFFRQSQSYLHEIAKIWEERRDIDILERVLRESEKERESAALMDYTYKEVIQEEDVNRYNIGREIHTRKFPSSCIVYSCWLFCWTTHLYA
jgi:signal transduction histidine kinase